MATKTQVNTDSAQTLSNKTLTAPILNSATCGADPTTPLGVCTKQFAESILAVVFPTGVMVPYGGAAPPAGFLLCDGSNVSRSVYAALFAVVSTFYGLGDGSTTFTLPDKRGRGSIGAGTGIGLTTRTRGHKIGTENETAPLPAHTHTYNTVQNVGGGGFLAGGGEKPSASATTGSTGPGGTHNNMAPVEVDLWIIKT